MASPQSPLLIGSNGAEPVLTLDQASSFILNRTPQFRPSHSSPETEPAGKECGTQLRTRTLSYLLVPITCCAIVGVELGKRFFPQLSIDCGGTSFSFEEVVGAVRNILQRGEGREGRAKLKRKYITPRDDGTLYFDADLQNAVLDELNQRYSEMYDSIVLWNAQRYEAELKARMIQPDSSSAALTPGSQRSATTCIAANAGLPLGVIGCPLAAIEAPRRMTLPEFILADLEAALRKFEVISSRDDQKLESFAQYALRKMVEASQASQEGGLRCNLLPQDLESLNPTNCDSVAVADIVVEWVSCLWRTYLGG